MLTDFFVQLLLSLYFFFSLVGIGLFILQKFNIGLKSNIYLKLGLSFFVSFCFYVCISTSLLYIFSGDPLKILHIFSVIFSLASLLYLIIYFFRNKNINLKFLFTVFKKNIVVFIALAFVMLVFFWTIYETAKVDEWLHRPVVKSFVQNNIFPLVNPLDPLADFSKDYHYGIYILGAEIAQFTNLSIPLALDLMKICFVLASFFLIYGLIYSWSKNIWLSAMGTVFIFFAGGSFFLFDAYAANHWWCWYKWSPQMRAFNFPLLVTLTGITWVNLPLSLAFIYLIKKQFLEVRKINLVVVAILWIILLVGFYLVSELFAMFIGGWIIILFFYYIWKKSQHPVISLGVLFLFLLLVTLLVLKFGGPLVGAFEKYSFSEIVSVRALEDWGYYTDKELVRLQEHPLFYLRNFLLEAFIVIVLLWNLIRKKIKISEQPLLFISSFVLFMVPFIFSTVMHNLNLYKLTHLGIILIYLLIFYLFAKVKINRIIFWTIIILFIFASIPQFFSSYNIQWGEPDHVKASKCNENICYDEDLTEILEKLEELDNSLKIIYADEKIHKAVVDLSNSYALTINKKNIEYFYKERNCYLMLKTKKKHFENKQGYNCDFKLFLRQNGYSIFKME
jgi:hypothetical protein